MGKVVKTYPINEQQTFSEEHKNELREMKLEFSDKEVCFLDLNPYNYSVSYFIGIDWLKENESCIVVHPKIADLDYVRMFVHCLKHPEISKFLKKSYHFDFKRPQIQLDTNEWELTPFMIVHFLSLVDKITKQGLKKNYIITEENVSSKIKGKIVFSQQLKKNIVTKREERVYCRYQEYSVNCLENHLLKKALLFVRRYSARHLTEYKELIQKENRILSCFENISEEISYSEIKRIKVNVLYKEYVEAIDLAKRILRHFGYSYKKADDNTSDRELPPFWIDMSKLFELYVYSLLKEEYRKEILYQPHGKYGNVDFLKENEKLIIDAKYKLVYTEDGKYDIKNIRQLSGYARDEGVLKKLEVFKPNLQEVDDEKIVDCVIIYPIDDGAKESFNGRKLKEEKISGFTKFYKCGIKLPVFAANNKIRQIVK
jgi:5-methylcytosine-specific restriction enzyme subunit McrC